MKSSSSRETPTTGRRLVGTAAIVIGLLHQDFWLWGDQRLLLGFLPAGLAYHMGFSVVVAALWLVALRVAWPSEWEAWAEEPLPSEDESPKA